METLVSRRLHRSEKATCPFDRFVVLENPRSSGRHTARRKLDEMKQMFPGVPMQTFETATGGAEAYERLLKKHEDLLGPKTLICIAAGDGSINFLVEALLLSPSLLAQVRRTPILPLWGGNGNDLASMLNGRTGPTSMHMVFNGATVVPVRVMHFSMVHADGTVKEKIACITASFGATAQAAHRLNDSAYRKSQLHHIPGGRYLMEGLTVWLAVASSSAFTTEQAGSVKNMYEYTFCNGPRMAKWYRAPIRLKDDQFYLSKMEGRLPVISPAKLLLSFRPRQNNERLHKTTQLVVHEPVWAQFDGEPELIPAGTEIRVRLSERPFYAFSRLLVN